ncbi:monocarboxylate transporter 13-like isoform X2 [Mytilus edulis]|uniref:monocarboxylate transporter 13-like isoform X2 n=1 Tax=Mytilus edulis TaxID=6550 RepID=UPI0039EFBD58
MVFKKTLKLSTTDNDKSDNIVKHQIKPDGGWGWIVTCAMCLCLCLSTALRSSMGILYTHMIDEFGFDLTMLSLLGSINGALSYTGAFFTVSLIERFGIRRVLCVGGLIQFTGCLMAAFSSSFVLLLISISIISGLGNALTYVTGVVAIDAYFDKKKTIAVSLATTGISLSRIIFPSTMEFLLSKYGFSDAMMIFSAILLNLVVCGVVVFPQRLASQSGVNLGYALAIKSITEPKYYSRGISMSLVMQGLGLLAGNPLAAYLQEVTGNRNAPYYFGTIIFLMTALVLLPFSGSIQREEKTIEIKVS